MKNIFVRFLFLSVLLAPVFLTRTKAQSNSTLSASPAAKWFSEGSWYRKDAPPRQKKRDNAFGRKIDSAQALPGSTRVLSDPSPDAFVNLREFNRQYHANPERWDVAFWWLRHTDLRSLPAGRYPVDGDDVYAIITDGPPNLFDSTEWESHRNFEDIHYVIAGREQIGIIPVGQAKLLRPYEPEKDLASYSADGKYFTGDPGKFYIVTTEEAHRPGLKVPGYDHLKKLCIKVRKS